MFNKPIGVFDSGLGGLTAVKELMKILPNEDIVYFGDTSRVPYGNRSKNTIIKYAKQDISFLLSTGVKIIIAACGTVSSVLTNTENFLNIPFTGVVKPTSICAVNSTKNKRIGVIGTTATIKSHSYRDEISKIDSSIKIFEQDCPLFVPLVENGFIDKNDPITNLVVERYLKPMIESKIDTLILGCTHYPIIKDIISKVIGKNIKLIDPGFETALYCANYLKEFKMLNDKNEPGKCSFYVSDDTDDFSKIAEIFLGENIQRNVNKVNIENY